MAYKVDELMFHIEVKSMHPPQAALKLESKGQQLGEIVFNCGRTVGAAGTLDEIEKDFLEELLEALRNKLNEL